jgi:galactokinase
MNTKAIKTAFVKHFNHEPIIVKSPGSVIIMGEHTDYNSGYAMLAAVDKAIYVAVSRRSDQEVHLYAESYSELVKSSTFELIKSEKNWANYILGVADQLQKWDYNIGGFNLYMAEDVPLGLGLSSSAAVTSATTYALIELFSLSVPKLDIARIAHKAEHTFMASESGIIDQFASVFGKKGNVLMVDCKSMKHQYIPFTFANYTLVVLDTNVKHSLSDSAYNRRRQQCEQGVAWVKANVSKVNSLRDVNLKLLEKYVKPKDVDVYQKCKFVVEENERVLAGVEQLRNGDLKGVGQAMLETHDGLSRAYRVSCEELDFLVESVKNLPYVLGARMISGFGGCTLNIVETAKVGEFIEKLQKAYKKEFLLKLDAYPMEIADGTRLVL